MSLKITDYTYDLPADRIALHPAKERQGSKLLLYNKGSISHENFTDITRLLPDNALLVFNNTRVIPARLHFTKDTGATLEVFLLSPVAPSALLAETMRAQHSATWKCTIGNLKRWTENTLLRKQIDDISLEAALVNREEGHVEFKWNTDHSFAEIVDRLGETPLPPYLKRSVDDTDKDRYQTVYAQHEGAVAAPTAGLHFTPEILQKLRAQGVETDFVTLHVSAGTFQPVKTENALDHPMHREQVIVTQKNLEVLLHPRRTIIPVGTTSMRTLESLYWFGVKLHNNPASDFTITQKEPYQSSEQHITREDALRKVLEHMRNSATDTLIGETSIYIHPGYRFRVCDALVTNFHQPGSTLILLVAAFIGEDWRKVYEEALQENYRFLSYGDSSLLIPKLM